MLLFECCQLALKRAGLTGDMYGDERLAKLLESQHHPTAQSTVDAILQAVTDFQAGTAHFDDETIVVLRVLEPPVPSH